MSDVPDGEPTGTDPTAEAGAEAVDNLPLKEDAIGSLGFLKAANRDFSENEIASAVTIRFLMERVKELQKEKEQLIPFQEQFYQKDRDYQIEKSKAVSNRTIEIVSTALTGAGGAGMGISASYFEKSPYISISGFVLFALVFASTLILKVRA